MIQRTAFVLGGGGARCALQVGALRALLEAGYRPDLVVGTSAGAINAAFLALHGLSREGLLALSVSWRRAGEADLLPANYLTMTLRAVLRRSPVAPVDRIREYLISNGIKPDLRFGDLRKLKLIVISTDLNSGKPILHGESPDDLVLDALLVSTALPPWVMPVRQQERVLMDGAVVSGLPIQAALRSGATDIVALDLIDPREPFGRARGFGFFLNQLTYAIEQRQVDLELELARASHVPVFYIRLTSEELVHIWDFGHSAALIPEGYRIARRAIEEHDRQESSARTLASN